MNRTLFIVSALSAFSLGCRPPTDLNEPCSLVKRNPDGGKTPVPILEKEVRNAQGQNKDFIAIGSVECEDKVCVRDEKYTNDAGPNDSAMGYCSKQCVQNSKCLSQNEALDKGSTALQCRALLLSAETLAALESSGGGFTGVKDPFFCARGGQ